MKREYYLDKLHSYYNKTYLFRIRKRFNSPAIHPKTLTSEPLIQPPTPIIHPPNLPEFDESCVGYTSWLYEKLKQNNNTQKPHSPEYPSETDKIDICKLQKIFVDTHNKSPDKNFEKTYPNFLTQIKPDPHAPPQNRHY